MRGCLNLSYQKSAESFAFTGKAVSDLRHDCVGGPIYIGRGEAEQANAGAHEGILAAVVIDQPIPVVSTVVFDCETLSAKKQIRTA